MRFLYLIEWNFTGFSGVERKIGSQVTVWKKAGHTVRAVIIGKHRCIDEQLIKDPDVDFWNIPSYSWMNKLMLDQLIKQSYFILAFLKYLFTSFDFVYYRQSTLSLAPLFALGRKLIIDVNSIDVEAKDGLKAIIEPVSKFYRTFLFGRAKLVCFITNELNAYYQEKYKLAQENCVVIGNGSANSQFDVEAIQHYFLNKAQKPRVKPCLLFVGSGDTEHYWHGYDKFIHIVAHFPEYDFLLVGEVGDQFKNHTNLTVINRMETADMPAIFFKADIGVGTLALHRKNMQEASPLKIAEYVFWGLPVITAYDDVNLKGLDFNLELANIEDNIHPSSLEQIRAFVVKNASRILNEKERNLISMEYLESLRMASVQSHLKELHE
jgi:hypothetical protein